VNEERRKRRTGAHNWDACVYVHVNNFTSGQNREEEQEKFECVLKEKMNWFQQHRQIHSYTYLQLRINLQFIHKDDILMTDTRVELLDVQHVKIK
jgi:hypothetical protein